MRTNGTWMRRGTTIVIDLGSPAAPTDSLERELESGQPTLRHGSQGSAVSDLQARLAALRFSPGPIDGRFGPLTGAAVRAFQSSRRIQDDGIVGPQTWAALGTQRAPAPWRPSKPKRPSYLPGMPRGGSLRARIVQIAKQELKKWDYGARKENDPAMSATLQDYWVTGVGIPDTGSPWSAAFISWVMRQAGADGFEYSSSHYVYISAAKRNAVTRNTANRFWAYRIGEAAPDVGDLVCNDREGDAGCDGTTYENVDSGRAWKTHCDIVTAVDRNRRELTVVGGNLGPTGSGSVKEGRVSIDANGLVLPQQSNKPCPFFAIIKIRD